MRGEKIMPSTQNAVNNHEYRSVPITALAESATNPRKRFDAKSLEELAASFKTQGILAPLLVRELEESKYEVVAGARRLRAAKLAELEKLPVRVVKLTDAEAIEAQCVENLQREDIHPLEEALGFKSLLELGEPAYTIATIASRAGKSEAYVYGRIRLADLIPPVAEAFLKDQITIGHALLIAKLPASQQQEAFAAAFRGQWTSEGNSQVLIPVRELAAWIESNILLQLASAPFDKQDETLVPEAGSCANCPKRTGFNKLLFPDVRKDSCTSPDCFRAKIDASVKKTLETKPQLIQISAAWNSREGAPLGRNQYVELEIKKPKANGASTKLPANQKPCDKMAEAIVMDGGKRGQVVKVCADPACRVHHPNTPSPQQVERERAEERKRIEKEKLAITTRHRVLATILQRVSAPLKKADLLAVAHYLIGHLSYSQVPALAKRHKVEAKKDSASAQELLAKQVGKYDEPNSASCFWKSACWIRLISDPPPAATTFSWTPPNATEWTLKSSRKPWPRNSPRNETRKQSSRRRSQDGSLSPSILDFWRSANLHSAGKTSPESA
jgi:ParB family transcriptional regulator, chromosome partitioning protein